MHSPSPRGIREELRLLDPGIGFGKTAEHNFELVRRLGGSRLSAVRCSSASRARAPSAAWCGAATGTTALSVGAALAAYERGASIIRAHDVREHVEALSAARAVRGA